MTILDGIILGVVQGLTEFLPISSSGHLVVFRQFLHPGMVEDVGFEVSVHAGTFLAVLIFFRQRIISLVTRIGHGDDSERRWILWLIVSTVPAGVVGLAVRNHIAVLFNSVTAVGIAWLVMSVTLWAAEHFGKETVSVSKMGVKKALAIGLAQAFALIPGISRSGSTLSIGMLAGINRSELIDFIFILSLPVVGGATLLTVPGWLDGSVSFCLAHLAGGISAALTGYAAIAIMLQAVKNRQLKWFAVYCAAAGILAIGIDFI